MTILRERLDEASEAWWNVASATVTSAPQSLYHYTSGAGLLGILETGTLRGTNFAFMNDRSEFGHGFDVLVSALEEKANAIDNPNIAMALVMAHKAARERTFDLYLTCFCEEPDLLSQWRGYGDQTSRYCIEFTAAKLPRADKVSPLQSVIYDEAAQARLVAEAIELFATAARKCDLSLTENRQAVASRIIGSIMPAMTRFKKNVFREEREWRCVDLAQAGNTDGLDFSLNDGIIRPHRILIRALDGHKLPITRVICGASRRESQARRSAELLLAKFGYLTEVTASQVPLLV